jgi:ammonia channel protein AmtB
MSGSVLLLLSAAVVALGTLTPAVLVMFAPKLTARMWCFAVAVVFCVAVACAIELWALGLDAASAVFLASSVAVSCAVVVSAGMRLGSPWRVAASATAIAVLLLAPLAISAFDTLSGPLAASVGVLDFGGCLTIAVAAPIAAVVLGTMRRPASPEPERAKVGWRRATMVAFAIALGILALELGSELLIDATSGILLTNHVLAAASGAGGWALVRTLTASTAPLSGFTAGVLSGSIAVLPGSPWLESPAAMVLGFGAGALGFLTTRALATRFGRSSALYLGTLLVPGVMAMLAAGIVTSPRGLLYSGHTDLLAAEVSGAGIATMAVVVGSFAVTRIMFVGWKPSEVGDAGLEPTTSSV